MLLENKQGLKCKKMSTSGYRPGGVTYLEEELS